jgi:chemotaxis protein histidine kinase CheA
MNKKQILFSIAAAMLMISACGQSKEKEEEVSAAEQSEKEKAEQTNENDDAEKSEVEEEEEKEEAEASDNTQNKSAENINPTIEEETGGDIEIVYTNSNPGLTHAYSDKVTISIEEYQIVHVSNMNESAKYNFDDEDEGYVITYKLGFENKLDEDVFFNASTMMLSDDGTENLYMKIGLVDREDWLKGDKDSAGRQYAPGKYTGMQSYTMTKAQYERLSAPTYTIDIPMLEDDFNKRIGKDAVFKIPFNDEGAEKASKTSALYADRMITDTIADKEIFFAKEDINETQKIDNVTITLEGIQYTDVTPTKAHASRFTNFGEGPLVALTAKLQIKNDSKEAIAKSLIDKRLILDQNRGTMLSQGMLEPFLHGDLNPGESEEILAVFLFRKDEFGLLKELKLQFGPLSDSNAKKLFKEKSVTFDLPMK